MERFKAHRRPSHCAAAFMIKRGLRDVEPVSFVQGDLKCVMVALSDESTTKLVCFVYERKARACDRVLQYASARLLDGIRNFFIAFREQFVHAYCILRDIQSKIGTLLRRESRSRFNIE